MIIILILVYLAEFIYVVVTDVKIVGGHNAIRKRYDWVACLYINKMVQLKNGTKFLHPYRMFTGSFITDQFLVSTCVPLMFTKSRPFEIRAGTITLTTGQKGWSIRDFPHPQCSQKDGTGPFLHDYSVIEVDKSRSKFTVPHVLLPVAHQSYRIMERMAILKTVCTVVGWGQNFRVYRDPQTRRIIGYPPRHLGMLNLHVMQNTQCQTMLCGKTGDYCPKGDHHFLATQQRFCVRPLFFESFNATKGVCDGDMGAPVVCENLLYGFVSQRFDCGSKMDDKSPIIIASLLGGYEFFKSHISAMPDGSGPDGPEFHMAPTHPRQWYTLGPFNKTKKKEQQSRSVIVVPTLSSILAPILVAL